jgi:hypothetical protein
MRQPGMGTFVWTKLNGGPSLAPLQVSCIGANSHLVSLKASADYVLNGLWLSTAQIGMILFRNVQIQESEPYLHVAKAITFTCPLCHIVSSPMRENSDGHHLNALSSYQLILILALEMKIWKVLADLKARICFCTSCWHSLSQWKYLMQRLQTIRQIRIEGGREHIIKRGELLTVSNIHEWCQKITQTNVACMSHTTWPNQYKLSEWHQQIWHHILVYWN